MSALTRDVTREDLPTVDHLFRTSFIDAFAHLYSAENLDSFLAQFTSEAWASEFADPRFAFRIAETDGVPVGFVKIGPMHLHVDSDRMKGARELYQFYLLDAARGTGIADDLMRWAVDKARSLGGTELFLGVFIHNHRAKRFYARHGFEYFGPSTFMVGDQADEDVIMKKVL
jgi:GNAT superfamily N-acetyltransferase